MAITVVVVLELVFVGMAVTNSSCSRCHLPQAKAAELAESPHAGQLCSSCHASSGGVLAMARVNLHAGANLLSYLTGGRQSPVGQSFSTACLSCHEKELRETVTVRGIRMNHPSLASPTSRDLGPSASQPLRSLEYDCTYCHAEVAHIPARGGTGSVDSHSLCEGSGCHDGATVSAACDVCHVEKPEARQTANPHPRAWSSSHGLGDLGTCLRCHQSGDCRECHGVDLPHDKDTFIYDHGVQAGASATACYSCHEAANCEACHAVPMPHQEQYLLRHGQDASENGPQVCANCHLESGCLRCHTKHLHTGVAPEIIEKLEKATAEQSGGDSPDDAGVSP